MYSIHSLRVLRFFLNIRQTIVRQRQIDCIGRTDGIGHDGDGDGSRRGREFGKHLKEISNSSTPPLKKISVFESRAATPKRYITQTLLPFYYLCRNHKPITMRNADLSNSIYQQKGSREGSLTIKNGMLINNRADGQTGIE